VDTLSYKTVSANKQTADKKWLLVDAEGQTVGRLASKVAKLIRGKHKPNFTPHADCGDNVIVINAEKVSFSGTKLVAKELGVKYDQKKLTHDINYNVRLGSFYIKKLIDEFNGSEMLAIASYNAGPNATKRWINEFYDPRLEKDYNKIVDWIELITYSETRNYVQRIIENMIVYKYLMSRNNYDQLQ